MGRMIRNSMGVSLGMCALLFVGGCGDGGGDQPVPVSDSDLVGHTFISRSVEGFETAPTGSVVLAFDKTQTPEQLRREKQATGLQKQLLDGPGLTASGGCNDQSAAYTLSGGHLKWKQATVYSTTAACIGPGRPLMAQDKRVKRLLSQGADLSTSDAGITLTNDQGVRIDFVETTE